MIVFIFWLLWGGIAVACDTGIYEVPCLTGGQRTIVVVASENLQKILDAAKPGYKIFSFIFVR